jgi:HTH-type transcriptional regulator/antitoxin HipB
MNLSNIHDTERAAMQTPIRTTGQLGPLLKRLRKNRNWSQTELGRRIGLSQERISTIENHPENVTLDNLFNVMMALEVHFSVIEPDPDPVPRGARQEDW